MPTRRNFLKNTCLSSAMAMCPSLEMLASTAAQTHLRETLPDAYFPRFSKWCPIVREYLRNNPKARLKELEAQKGWYHFPYTILPAAVLYALPNRANPHHGDHSMLELTMQIGDLLVREDEAGALSPRLDSDRDAYMWLEAYGLIKNELGSEQRRAWRKALQRNVELLLPDLRASKDIASYVGDFLGSSPNHVAWWAATVLIGGLQLERPDWVELSSAVLRRFATTEQNPDGYWGEHNPNGPTAGYNYLTAMTVGVYWEHTHDPQALEALRRATTFHSSTTYSDGNVIELFNDRNRYWEVSPWGQFAFSHFPAGRGYAQLLLQHTPDDEIDLDTLGMLAQNALYYHAGSVAPCPPEQEEYVYRIASPIGVRKRGPWMVGLSGIVDTPLPKNQWFLDRQANLSLFHKRAGLIIAGANSRHQPELATFSEKNHGIWESTPIDGRLDQRSSGDLLAVAHNSFSAEIAVPPTTPQTAEIVFRITGRGPAPEEAYLGLQLCLHPGEKLETAAGRSATVSNDKVEWSASDIGGELRHGSWALKLDADATLQWPVFPYNPYRNGLETKLEHAVALLRVPLNLKTNPNQWLQINERTIHMRVTVDDHSVKRSEA